MDTNALSLLTVKELRVLAAERGLARTARLTKAELVGAIAASAAGQPVAAAPEVPATPAPALPAPAAPAAASQPPAAPMPTAPMVAANQAPTDFGLPVPDQYGLDRVVLLVQDPHHLFAYWEISQQRVDAAQAACGHRGAPVLVVHGPDGVGQREIDLRGGNYYLTAVPNSGYRVDLALRRPDGSLDVLLSSSAVTTPAAGPSWRTDESWLEVDETARRDAAGHAPMHRELSGAITKSFQASAGSGERFRNQRRLAVRAIGEDESSAPAAGGAAPALPEAFAGGAPSSLALALAGVPEAFAGSSSSHLLGSRALVGGAVPAGSVGLSSLHGSRAVAKGAVQAAGSSWSSRAVSSRILSSRAVSSGAVVAGGPGSEVITSVESAPATYPVNDVFVAAPTGLPKSAEGVSAPAWAPPATPAAPARTTQTAQAGSPGGPPPSAPQPGPVSQPPSPVTAPDQLAFIGAPKPPGQRRGKAPRR